MISFIFNIIAWLISLALPASASFYTSGVWLGGDVCLEESRLPDNPDVEIIERIVPPPQITARSFVVLTDNSNIWLSEKDSVSPQAMASITKLMTALVFLDHNPGWDTEYQISKDDMVSGGKIHFFVGDTMTLRDLFNSALVASDNGAALALARSTKLTDEEFVKAMNEKAKDLALMQTHFVDPIGLGDGNVAHAKDIARLAQKALNEESIAQAVLQSNYSFKTKENRDKFLESTDWLLESNLASGLESLGGKTGYTEAAGYSFVGRFKDELGRSLIIVVLDSGGKNERFEQAQALAVWAFQYCKW